jgi:hypothetical protein
MSTMFGATLAALIICHRGTLQHLCKKLLLVDQVLSVPPEVYKRRRVMLTAEIMIVFCATGAMHVFDMQDRRMDYIKTMEIFGWILVSYINNTVILQFLNCVRIIKNRFEKLNAELSEMIVSDFEEEELNKFLFSLNNSNFHLSKPSGGYFGRGFDIIRGSVPEKMFRDKIKSRIFIYDPVRINTLRLAHSVLYKLTRCINSDFGIQILLEMLHSFISLIMATYVPLTVRADPHLTSCGQDADCVRVVTHICLAAICITKFVAITAFCQAASDEIARTPVLVRRLLLPRPLEADTLIELQLFSQQMSNINSTFTAFGFFTLNLKLLSSVAAAATTYIVILIQSRPVVGA